MSNAATMINRYLILFISSSMDYLTLYPIGRLCLCVSANVVCKHGFVALQEVGTTLTRMARATSYRQGWDQHRTMACLAVLVSRAHCAETMRFNRTGFKYSTLLLNTPQLTHGKGMMKHIYASFHGSCWMLPSFTRSNHLMHAEI